ncbi:hypothetical protein GJ496_004673 [Pomphorhynchus laevis]|nr:hypothetical protein GJ496_004673 [Pomphorhynchus laevis]
MHEKNVHVGAFKGFPLLQFNSGFFWKINYFSRRKNPYYYTYDGHECKRLRSIKRFYFHNENRHINGRKRCRHYQIVS